MDPHTDEYHRQMAEAAQLLGPDGQPVQRPEPQRLTLADGVRAGWLGGAELIRVLRLDASDGPFSPAICYTGRPWTRREVWASVGAPAFTLERVEQLVARVLGS